MWPPRGPSNQEAMIRLRSSGFSLLAPCSLKAELQTWRSGRAAPTAHRCEGPDKKQKPQRLRWGFRIIKSRRRPTLPRRCQRSTIGAGGLNFRVRDGNGCNPSAKATGNSKNLWLRPGSECRRAFSSRIFKRGKFYGQASRPISTGKLRTLPHFHTQPITW